MAVSPVFAAPDAEPLATTIKLINEMVERGELARAKADLMIKDAQNRAEAAKSQMREELKRELLAEMKGEMAADIKRELLAEMKGEMAADIKRQVLADLTGPGVATPSASGAEPAPGQDGDKPKSRVVRVPYVPEVVRRELHDQIREEVLAQAKTERWGDPGALPDWLNRINWEGDMRLRYQFDMLPKSNSPSSDYVLANRFSATTRAPDLGSSRDSANLSNTQQDRERLRLRMRLGMTAKISDDFSAGVRITTGNTSDRVSTNQTLGQNFNKYSVVLDRAFLKYEPTDWLSLTGGRIPNPWFGTDLVWHKDLNFEGVAATLRRRSNEDTFSPFLTVGAFPLREDNPPTRNNRWLEGAQTGFQLDINPRTSLKLGVAYYSYRHMEGRQEPLSSFVCAPTCTLQSAAYGQYEYESGLRQKGNTLFATNALNDPNYTSTPIWGLASRFNEVNVTALLDLAHWDPVHAVLIGDYVKNIGYNKGDILNRTGLRLADFPDGDNTGYMLKLQVGWPKIKSQGDWNAFIAYRRLGSDAVLDAFNDSDFGLGGTNTKGYQIGLAYGLDRNVELGLRWMSADSIDSMIPSSTTLGGLSSGKTKFSVDLLQLDVSARF